MDNFKSRLIIFCTEVCEKNRYFYSDITLEFLKDLYDYVTSEKIYCVKHIPDNKVFYRARAHDFINTTNAYTKIPFNSEEMKPAKNMRANGRLNAYNVNALYLAEDQSTAVSEVRAAAGAPISVAAFQTNKELKVLRFDYTSDAIDAWSYCFNAITYDLAYMFSQPLDNPEHQSREYIPTQIIAEYFKSKGIDGIEYPSQFISDTKLFQDAKSAEPKNPPINQSTRFNLCLFDVNAADCVPGTIEVLSLKKRMNIVGDYEA